MENWNRDNWQGRRKDQYESSSKILFWSLTALIVVFVLISIAQ